MKKIFKKLALLGVLGLVALQMAVADDVDDISKQLSNPVSSLKNLPLRYDYDKDEYEKFKLKEEKNKHPLNHYDIFYSSINSFKLGLKKEISHEDFINILNTNKDCKYIEK